MPRWILFDEFHLTLHVPQSLSQADCRAITRVLNGRRFQTQLREAVRNVLGRHASLGKVRVVISR
jgi:hypothetical protein